MLYSLVNQVNVYLFITNWVPREDTDSQHKLLQSCPVRSLEHAPIQPKCLQCQLPLLTKQPARPLPHWSEGGPSPAPPPRERGRAQDAEAQHSALQLGRHRQRASGYDQRCPRPSQNGILSRYFSLISVHLPKANASGACTSSSLPRAVRPSGCSLPPDRVLVTYAGDRKHTPQVSHVQVAVI